MKSMAALFLRCIEDVYDAEKQILAALPMMAAASETADLKEAFEEHHKETEVHITRLDAIFEMLELHPHEQTCEPVQMLVEKAEELVRRDGQQHVVEAGLIAEAQSLEHYEIARYGTLMAWATELGYDEALPLLQATLDEEKSADRKLSAIAERQVNRRAA